MDETHGHYEHELPDRMVREIRFLCRAHLKRHRSGQGGLVTEYISEAEHLESATYWADFFYEDGRILYDRVLEDFDMFVDATSGHVTIAVRDKIVEVDGSVCSDCPQCYLGECRAFKLPSTHDEWAQRTHNGTDQGLTACRPMTFGRRATHAAPYSPPPYKHAPLQGAPHEYFQSRPLRPLVGADAPPLGNTSIHARLVMFCKLNDPLVDSRAFVARRLENVLDMCEGTFEPQTV